MNVGNWIRRNSSTILTCFGAGGMIATIILAVKATPKAMRACTDAQVEKGRNQLTKLEIMRAAGPAYIPAAATGIGTLACIFGANVLSRRQQAAMTSAYVALASSFEAYRDKVKNIFGEGADRYVADAVEKEKKTEDDDTPPWDEVQTFYIDGYGKFFERTMQQVIEAEYRINRNLILRGDAPFNEFLSFLDLPPMENGDILGWNQYYGETYYGYQWIDFNHRHHVTADGILVCSIDMPFPPHPMHEEPRDEDFFMSTKPHQF